MSLVTSNDGELRLLDYMLKAVNTSENFVLHLYNNNATPAGTSVIGDFIEATFTNYAAYTLTRGSWASAITSNFGGGTVKAYSTYATQTWSCGASGDTIYGYYVTTDGGNLLWAESFSSPRVLFNTDTLLLTPVFTLNSESN
jgi:hypothetical protein